MGNWRYRKVEEPKDYLRHLAKELVFLGFSPVLEVGTLDRDKIIDRRELESKLAPSVVDTVLLTVSRSRTAKRALLGVIEAAQGVGLGGVVLIHLEGSPL